MATDELTAILNRENIALRAERESLIGAQANVASENAPKEYERYRAIVFKALELAGPQHPAFNLQPYIELVRAADALGLDVVKRS
jgi:hypothetical protein